MQNTWDYKTQSRQHSALLCSWKYEEFTIQLILFNLLRAKYHLSNLLFQGLKNSSKYITVLDYHNFRIIFNMKMKPNTALKYDIHSGVRAGDWGPRGQKERILNRLFPLSGWHSETFQDIGAIHPTKLGEEKYAWHFGEPPQRVSKDPDTVQWSYTLHHCPCTTQLSYTHNHCSYSNSRATGAWESRTPGVCRWRILGNGDSHRAQWQQLGTITCPTQDHLMPSHMNKVA